MLTERQLQMFRGNGHVTVADIFPPETVQSALHDVAVWSSEFLATMEPTQRSWFLEPTDPSKSVLRKLDEPVFQREVFRAMARAPRLVEVVEQLIGPGVCVFFSQVFCKPAEVGGPKPVHQDNFYFGPDVPDATLTVWIALDDATTENGCLFYADGSHKGPIYPHEAPVGEPFNLQIPRTERYRYALTAAPVPAGGVSFHHGNTWHQSSPNRSSRARRAAAFHFLRNDAKLVAPALAYDPAVTVVIS